MPPSRRLLMLSLGVVLVFAPTAGNCLTAPVTQIAIFRAGTLKS